MRSRQAVERERERLAIILSRLSTGVIVTDRELTLHSANQSAGTILGNSFEGAAGQRLTQLPAGDRALCDLHRRAARAPDARAGTSGASS